LCKYQTKKDKSTKNLLDWRRWHR